MRERSELQSIFKLDDVAYVCGGTLQELNLPEKFSFVFVGEHNRFEPIEKLFYSAGFQTICVYCAEGAKDPEIIEVYPTCSACSNKDPIRKSIHAQILKAQFYFARDSFGCIVCILHFVQYCVCTVLSVHYVLLDVCV